MDKKIFLALCALVFLAASCNAQPTVISTYNDGKIILANREIKIEVAKTPLEKSRGLSGRNEISEEEGMLFIFEQPSKPSFWMKDMLFDIDIVWINGDTVVDIAKNATFEPNVADANLKLYSPREDADKVLELKSGWVDKFGLKVGDKLIIEINQ
ncbi:MAG TPA: DUF192 domain-containing protein [Verrucomicrobiae bacterium]|nr:DUF192 domain-containing protein [Verrucomicrobiae bacterium]